MPLVENKITPRDVKLLFERAYDLSNTEKYNVIIEYSPITDSLEIRIFENSELFGQKEFIKAFNISLNIRGNRGKYQHTSIAEFNNCWDFLKELENKERVE